MYSADRLALSDNSELNMQNMVHITSPVKMTQRRGHYPDGNPKCDDGGCNFDPVTQIKNKYGI